jgi:hypothetical protein
MGPGVQPRALGAPLEEGLAIYGFRSYKNRFIRVASYELLMFVLYLLNVLLDETVISWDRVTFPYQCSSYASSRFASQQWI